MVIGERPQLLAAHCEAERGRASVGWWAVEGQRMVRWRYEPNTARPTCSPYPPTQLNQHPAKFHNVCRLELETKVNPNVRNHGEGSS